MKLMKLSCLLTMAAAGSAQLQSTMLPPQLPYSFDYFREFSYEDKLYIRNLVPRSAHDIYMGKISDGALFVFYKIADINMPHNTYYGFIGQRSHMRMMTCEYHQPSKALDASLRYVTHENGVFEFYRQILYPMHHGQFLKLMRPPVIKMTGLGRYNGISLVVKHFNTSDELL